MYTQVFSRGARRWLSGVYADIFFSGFRFGDDANEFPPLLRRRAGDGQKAEERQQQIIPTHRILLFAQQV